MTLSRKTCPIPQMPVCILDSSTGIIVCGSLLWHIFKSYLKCLFHKCTKRTSSSYLRKHFTAQFNVSKLNYLVVLSNCSSTDFFGWLFWFSCDVGPSWPLVITPLAVLGLLSSVWTSTLVVKKNRQLVGMRGKNSEKNGWVVYMRKEKREWEVGYQR